MTPLSALVMAVYYTLSTMLPIAFVVAIWRHLPPEDRRP